VIIETRGMSHTYSKGMPFEKTALRDIDLKINEGEFIGVIGHTGSGKSTLIQHFNALLRPTSGKIFIDGKDIWLEPKKVRDIRFKVGMVFQYPEHQLFEETVYDDVAFGPKNMKLSKEEIDVRVRQALSFVSMDEEYLQRSPVDLSGGQKRRVAIAGVIAMRPKVLVLDEPTAGLDPLSRAQILQNIKDYHVQMRSTVILVSHSMEDIALSCDRVIVMNDSRIELFDSVKNVFSDVRRLNSIGLDVPEVTKIFVELKKRGHDVRTDITTVEEGFLEIRRFLEKGGEIS